jgi:hypothetical protein
MKDWRHWNTYKERNPERVRMFWKIAGLKRRNASPASIRAAIRTLQQIPLKRCDKCGNPFTSHRRSGCSRT